MLPLTIHVLVLSAIVIVGVLFHARWIINSLHQIRINENSGINGYAAIQRPIRRLFIFILLNRTIELIAIGTWVGMFLFANPSSTALIIVGTLTAISAGTGAWLEVVKKRPLQPLVQ